MVFPIVYNGSVYRVSMPSLVKNRISLINMTEDEEEDRTIRVLRSIRYYAKIDNNKFDDDTIMAVFKEANRLNLLPDFMKKYDTLPSRTTPKQRGLSQEQKNEAVNVASRKASDTNPVGESVVVSTKTQKTIRIPIDENSIFI